MKRYIVKLIDGLTGTTVFIASSNKPVSKPGRAICANCGGRFQALKRQERFCIPECKQRFLSDLRKYEKENGKLTIAPEDKQRPGHKAKKAYCKNPECKKPFYTFSLAQKFCSTECRIRAGKLEKHKDNKHWQRRQRIIR